MISIQTEKRTFRVWTRRTGNAPGKTVLLRHGGPGGTHEALKAFDSHFAAADDFLHSTLRPAMDPDVRAELEAFEAAGDLDNPRYGMRKAEHVLRKHACRLPISDWPSRSCALDGTTIQRSGATWGAASYLATAASSGAGIAPPIWTGSRRPC